MIDHDPLHRRGASALSAASAYEVELAVSAAYAGFSVSSPANVGLRSKLAVTIPSVGNRPIPAASEGSAFDPPKSYYGEALYGPLPLPRLQQGLLEQLTLSSRERSPRRVHRT